MRRPPRDPKQPRPMVPKPAPYNAPKPGRAGKLQPSFAKPKKLGRPR